MSARRLEQKTAFRPASLSAIRFCRLLMKYVDILAVRWESRGAALIYYTVSKRSSRVLRGLIIML